MAEVLANLYAITGEKKYLDISYKFYDKRILDPLAAHQDILPGKHSNTQIPKIIASARRFELTGDTKDKAIADFFWTTVTENHSYATGGNSNYEYLGEPGKLNDKLTENTTETCNTYNMLKLTRHLFAVQPSAALMDYYEKSALQPYFSFAKPPGWHDVLLCSAAYGRQKGVQHAVYHFYLLCWLWYGKPCKI